MANFTAQIKKGPKLIKVPIVADDLQHARQLAGMQGKVMSVKKASSLDSLFNRGMTSDERIVFLSRLSTMVRSRMGMGDSLKVMMSAFKGPIARVSRDLYRRVESGADFGDAVVSMPKDFPQTTAALIRAGIRGGDIYSALSDAARFEAEMDSIRRDSSRGLMSAVGSFMISAAIILITSVWVGPYVMESDLIRAAGDSVNVDWVFTLAEIISYIMVAITGIFVFLLLLAYVIKPALPSFADKVILRIPIYRDLVLAQNHYTVFYGMGLLAKSGVRMEDTLRLSAESAPPGEVAEDLRRALDAVRHGKNWAAAMRNLHPTDRAALSTSQDREQVGQSLDAVSHQYKESYSRRVQQVVPAMQLVSALFMSIGGGLIFGMIILPMLQMTQGLL